MDVTALLLFVRLSIFPVLQHRAQARLTTSPSSRQILKSAVLLGAHAVPVRVLVNDSDHLCVSRASAEHVLRSRPAGSGTACVCPAGPQPLRDSTCTRLDGSPVRASTTTLGQGSASKSLLPSLMAPLRRLCTTSAVLMCLQSILYTQAWGWQGLAGCSWHLRVQHLQLAWSLMVSGRASSSPSLALFQASFLCRWSERLRRPKSAAAAAATTASAAASGAPAAAGPGRWPFLPLAGAPRRLGPLDTLPAGMAQARGLQVSQQGLICHLLF